MINFSGVFLWKNMTTSRYKLCRGCGQRYSYDNFGLADTRDGRQETCHDCVLEMLKKKGILETRLLGQIDSI